MIQAAITGAIIGALMTLAGVALVHVLLGLLELGGRFARVIDRTPNYIIITAAFTFTGLVVAYLAQS